MRGLLAAAVIAVGYVGSAHSLAQASRSTDIERAYRVSPGNAQIVALFAQRLSGVDATAADRARADQLARYALRHDATAIVAVSTLGINAQARGRVEEARRLFAFSEALSRRDMQTQLWAIEDATTRNDVADALKHYDIALRTSPRASNLLFPIMASAISDREIRRVLLQTLSRGANWGPHFINYVASQGPEPRAATALFVGLERARVRVSPEAHAALVNNLISRELYRDAWAYYVTSHPGASQSSSRDPEFQARPEEASLFDWVPLNGVGITTSMHVSEGRGGFDFAASPSVGGPLLQQMQMLPPGEYVLEGRSRDIDQAPGERPYWVLQCRTGPELGRAVVPNSADAKGIFGGNFTVPSDCPAQILALVAVPTQSITGLAGTIERAELRRR